MSDKPFSFLKPESFRKGLSKLPPGIRESREARAEAKQARAEAKRAVKLALEIGMSRPKYRRGRKRGSQSQETIALDNATRKAKEDIARDGGDPSSTKDIVSVLAAKKVGLLPAGWRQKYGVRSWAEVARIPQILRLAAKRFARVKTPRL